MMYPFMELNDKTQITHSEIKPDGKVKVYIERPDERDCFHHATCWLPSYQWEDISGFSEIEMQYFKEFVESIAHLVFRYAKCGGFDNASGL